MPSCSWHIILVVGILLIVAFIIGFIYFKKKKGAQATEEYVLDSTEGGNQDRINSTPNLKTLEPLIEEDPMVDLFDRKFPQSTVKAWKDITLEKELGSGQFGKVYKGFLHLGKYTR